MLVSAVVLSGCGSTEPEEPTAPAVTSISVSVPSQEGFGEAWDGILNEWTARTGVAHTLTESEEPATQSELAADLNLIPATACVELAAKGLLRPIPTIALSEDQLDWKGLFQGLREQGCTLGGTPSVIPLSLPTLVVYYRADLLAKSGRQPPQTWDDYLKLAKEMGDWAAGLKFCEPARGRWGATLYLARAAAFAKHPDHTAFLFDLETGDPLIDSPGFQKAWDLHRELFSLLPAEGKEMTPLDCRREIIEGRAALAIALEPPGLSRNSTAGASASSGSQRGEGVQLGFVQLPGVKESFNPTLKRWEAPREGTVHQVTLTGFDGLAAVVSEKLSEEGSLLAWNLLQTVTLDDGGVIPEGIASPVREADLTRPEAFTSAPLEPIERGEYLAVVGRGLRNRQLVLEMPVIGRNEFLNSLADLAKQGVSGEGIPGENFTKGVAERWRAIGEKLGKSQVRDSYRIAHGMRPIPAERVEAK